MNRKKNLLYIQKILTCGSLTGAAKALGLSQPALSQAITGIEKDLGIQIFNRRSSPITFTEEGELYYRYLCRAERLEEGFVRQLAHRKETASRQVSIAAPAVYVKAIILPAVMQLLEQMPDCRIKIRTASVEKAVQYAAEGQVDMFISTSPHVPANFYLEPIYQEEIVLCAPIGKAVPCNPEGEPILSELTEETFLALDPEYPLQKEIDHFLEMENVRLNAPIVVDQVSVATDMVEKGGGFCFAQKYAALGKKVKTYPMPLPTRDIYLARDEDLFHSEASSALREILKSRGNQQFPVY